MDQITIDKNVLLVEVQRTAQNIGILDIGEGPELAWDCAGFIKVVDLPEGSWQFIGTTDEVSEAICEKIFDKPTEKTRYEIGGEDFITATAAWNYLRRVNRIPSDKRFAILKQAA